VCPEYTATVEPNAAELTACARADVEMTTSANRQKTNVENVRKTLESLKDRVKRTKEQIEEISATV
jgi:methyl-accepting chemotaxis protein